MAAARESTTSRTRVALYSHDTVGLGHARRSLAVAEALTAGDPATDAILITGNPEAAMLPRPPRTDLVALPGIGKAPTGSYRPRHLGAGLDEVVRLRTAVIAATLRELAPHLLVVDKVAAGLDGELRPALEELARHGGTRVVLGLREVLDAPSVTRREWGDTRTSELIARCYDEIWVYGDPAVFDPVREYGWSESVASKVRHLGYVGHPHGSGRTAGRSTIQPPREPYVLCQVGGGEDGFALADAFTQASLPWGHHGVVLSGPYLSAQDRARLHQAAPAGMTVLDFVDNPHDFIAAAAAVVSMAGYNSTVELLGTKAPVLMVPRARPRAEQLIRAGRLAELGHVDLLPSDALSSDRIAEWTAQAVCEPGVVDRSALDLDGWQQVAPAAFRLIEGAAHVA